jgi:hypothetical protein
VHRKMPAWFGPGAARKGPAPAGTSRAAYRCPAPALLTLSVLVGAISMARAVDDPDLSEQIMTSAAAALKQCVLK